MGKLHSQGSVPLEHRYSQKICNLVNPTRHKSASFVGSKNRLNRWPPSHFWCSKIPHVHRVRRISFFLSVFCAFRNDVREFILVVCAMQPIRRSATASDECHHSSGVPCSISTLAKSLVLPPRTKRISPHFFYLAARSHHVARKPSTKSHPLVCQGKYAQINALLTNVVIRF